MTEQLTITTGTASVADTVEALRAQLEQRGIPIFAVIDHSAGAASVDLELADEVLVIFGNPAVGTHVMQADAKAGIDLPLRVLIWKQGDVTQIAYEDPHALASRFDVGAASTALDGMANLLAALTADIAAG